MHFLTCTLIAGARPQARRRFTQATPPALCLTDRRSYDGSSDPEAHSAYSLSRWRTRDRIKTQAAALVLCLNIGVDPPDVVKVSPCARLQCWINPDPQQATRNTASIAKALQAQYERWQPRARYKSQTDPTVDDVKRLCRDARRTARVRTACCLHHVAQTCSAAACNTHTLCILRHHIYMHAGSKEHRLAFSCGEHHGLTTM